MQSLCSTFFMCSSCGCVIIKPKKYAKLESTSLYCHYIAIALIFIQDNLVALALHGGTMHYRSLPRGHMWIMQVYFY